MERFIFAWYASGFSKSSTAKQSVSDASSAEEWLMDDKEEPMIKKLEAEKKSLEDAFLDIPRLWDSLMRIENLVSEITILKQKSHLKEQMDNCKFIIRERCDIPNKKDCKFKHSFDACENHGCNWYVKGALCKDIEDPNQKCPACQRDAERIKED